MPSTLKMRPNPKVANDQYCNKKTGYLIQIGLKRVLVHRERTMVLV